MTTMRTLFSAAAALLLLPGVCHGLLETCEDLQDAFELTKTQDVEVEIHPFQDITCDTWTNMTMDSNTLTVKSSEENLENFFGSSTLTRVRFVVTDGAKLFWETNAVFDGVEDEEEVNNDGGGVYVGAGSTVRFLNDLEMRDLKIINERDFDSDFASFVRSGGCIWTNGYFRVDGFATLTRCDITGAGESPPGPGGAVYVGESGSVLFNEGVDIADTKITDDFGGRGGAIYNLGKVNIKGSSRFEDLRAAEGGAIFNGENAQFNFRRGASAFFRDVSNRDSSGSALYNLGYFKFSGPALFVETAPPAIVVGVSSETIISEDSAFWDFDSDEPGSEAIAAAFPGSLDDESIIVEIPSSVTFVGFAEPDL